MLNKRFIIHLIGWMLIFESVFMFICAGVSAGYGESDLRAFIYSGLITLGVGGVLWLPGRNFQKELGKREGYLIVSISWIVISAFGALPFLLSGAIPDYTDAFFETISGFTTTGASVLSDIEALPHGVLFWRSLTHLIGGMGILVLAVAILPFFGLGGMQLYNAEVAGISNDKLKPRITQTAKRLWGVYMGLIGIQTLLLCFGGMSLFDALCHSFATLASGGFSTKNDSAASFSPYIQYVLIIFMILAGTNFALIYYASVGDWRKLFKNREFRVYVRLLFLVSLSIGLFLHFQDGLPFEKSLRDSTFQVVSVVTSTGFGSSDYTLWHPSITYLFLILMFSGACIGSTSGGVKLMRHMLLSRNALVEFKRMIHPNAVIPLRVNGRIVQKDVVEKVMAFIIIYASVFLIGSLALTILGMDMESAMGAAATTMGGIGPGLGSVGPASNFAAVPELGKWVLSFLMLAGRLEIYSLLMIFTGAFWRD